MQALPHPHCTRAATRSTTSRASIACATAALIALLLAACAAPSSNTGKSGSNGSTPKSSQASTEDGRLLSDRFNTFTINLPRNWSDETSKHLDAVQAMVDRDYLKSDDFFLLNISTDDSSRASGVSACNFHLSKVVEKTKLTNQGMEQYLNLSEEKFLQTTLKQGISNLNRTNRMSSATPFVPKSIKLLTSSPFTAGAHQGWLQERELTVDGFFSPPHHIAIVLPFHPTTNPWYASALQIYCWQYGTHTKEPVFGSSMHDKLLAMLSTIQIKYPPLEQTGAK